MQSITEAIRIRAAAQDVHAFVSRPENLPRWAIGFCKSIRRDGEGWRVDTGHGEVGLMIAGDEASGIVDYRMSPSPGVDSVAYSRVVPVGNEAEYVFTMHQDPTQNDEAFAAAHRALRDELRFLRTLVEPCPASGPEQR